MAKKKWRRLEAPMGHVELRGSFILASQRRLSITHIQSAAHFSRQSAEVEQEYDGQFSDELFAQHMSVVIAALFAAVAFLESTVNEFFAAAADEGAKDLQNLDDHMQTRFAPDVVALLADMWNGFMERKYSILEKYDLALTLTRNPKFDTGKRPYQDVDDLISLRNSLMHYKPEWVVAHSDDPNVELTVQKLKERLRSKNFILNPLYDGSVNPFFPDLVLSYGCAKWAVEACLAFADEFFGKLGLPVPYDHIRERLKM